MYPTYTNPRRKKFTGVLAVVALVLVLFAIGLVVFIVSKPAPRTATRCLTKEDFQAFTGTQYTGEFNPGSNFYTTSVKFDGSTYRDKASSEAYLKKIGSFYKSHPNSAIYLTITASYTSDYDSKTADARLDKILRDLVANGIDEADIRAVPKQIEEDVEGVPLDFVTVAITSPEGCSE